MEGIGESELRYLHDIKGMSQRDIGVYYSVSHPTIKSRMVEYGITSHTKRKYNINEDFFKTWTPESAWLYGWAIGDGNFTLDRVFRFDLQRADREVLEKFRMAICSNHPITECEQWDKRYKKYYEKSRIAFSSKEIVDDLKQLSYFDVPECYLNHFVRGFFEAEGGVYWNKKNTPKGGSIKSDISQKDEEILYFILWQLHDSGVVNHGVVYSHGNMHILKFSVYDSISLYRYMYDSCGNMFLKRKKEKFEELIEKQVGVN